MPILSDAEALKRANLKIMDLEARIAELEDAVSRGENDILERTLRLTAAESRVLRMLIQRETCGHYTLHVASVPPGGVTTDSDPEVVKVHICRLRKKLAPYGVVISNRFAIGYYLDHEMKQRLLKIEQDFNAVPQAQIHKENQPCLS
jgi:DNA-binding response OmpR family regulator